MAAPFIEGEIAVIGAGLGGVAAALAAAEAGRRVVLTEPTDWIGGQITSQAVSTLDEHHLIERFGGTSAYNRFREAVRADYRQHYPNMRGTGAGEALNPGNGWASRLCFEPRVGLRVLEAMLAPHIQAGRVRLLLSHIPVAAEVKNGRIQSVTLAPVGVRAEAQDGAPRVALYAQVFLDASEEGDLLALAGAPFVTGEEAVEHTGEPHASKNGPHPERSQSFTWSFLVEYCLGQNHTIRKPYGYDYYRQSQPFTLVLRQSDGGFRHFPMFRGERPFWTYRRVFDASQFVPGAFALGERGVRDVAVINWDANDYYKESPIGRSQAQRARILNEARRLSLSFLYWLQTEAPHDTEGIALPGVGYPGLRLLPEAAGTPDGLAKAPYIRESRRLIGFRRVLEQDIVAAGNGTAERGARAANFADTVGIGWYPIDLHRCAGDPPGGEEQRVDFGATQPFQIPLGAMLSPAMGNLVATAKNISTTHITNGAYRVHPVEWAIGEAAGALAAACMEQEVLPRRILEEPQRLRAFQKRLLARGVPLLWTSDLAPGQPDFTIIQSVLLHAAAHARALMPEGSPRRDRLEILPNDLLSRTEGAWLVEHLPQARENSRLSTLLTSWKDAPLGPVTGADWASVCAALDQPAPPASDYPTLRQVCQKLVKFV